MKRIALAVLAVALLVPAIATAHTTAPTSLIVVSKTDTSVRLDWKQDYVDDYSGYFVRTNGGARVAYPSSEGTVAGLQPGTTYQFCVSIDLSEPDHADESGQTCISATTTGGAPPPPPPPAACADGLDNDGDGFVDLADAGCSSSTDTDETNVVEPPPPPPPSGYPRFSWAKSSSSLAEFQKMKSLGFTHSMVDPNPTQLATLAQAGLRAVIWGGNYSDGCVWNWSDSVFTTKVNSMKTSPHIGIVDYMFIADEPHIGTQCKATGFNDMRSRHNLSKSLLPSIPTMVSENRTDEMDELLGTTDIFLAIKYPCSNNSCTLSKVDQTVAKVKSSGFTNWWAVVQSFKEPSGGYYTAPTATQLRQILDRWELGNPNGLAAYAWGDGCCGDDIGLRDLPDLHPVWLAENTQ